jgi:hypothetical protein
MLTSDESFLQDLKRDTLMQRYLPVDENQRLEGKLQLPCSEIIHVSVNQNKAFGYQGKDHFFYFSTFLVYMNAPIIRDYF